MPAQKWQSGLQNFLQMMGETDDDVSNRFLTSFISQFQKKDDGSNDPEAEGGGDGAACLNGGDCFHSDFKVAERGISGLLDAEHAAFRGAKLDFHAGLHTRGLIGSEPSAGLVAALHGLQAEGEGRGDLFFLHLGSLQMDGLRHERGEGHAFAFPELCAVFRCGGVFGGRTGGGFAATGERCGGDDERQDEQEFHDGVKLVFGGDEAAGCASEFFKCERGFESLGLGAVDGLDGFEILVL